MTVPPVQSGPQYWISKCQEYGAGRFLGDIKWSSYAGMLEAIAIARESNVLLTKMKSEKGICRVLTMGRYGIRERDEICNGHSYNFICAYDA